MIGEGDKDNNQYDHMKYIGSAYGVSMLIHRDVFLSLGGFDEHFFMYHEEADLCWRGWIQGYPTIYCPESIVYHFKSLNWSKNSTFFREFHQVKNRIMTILKNTTSNLLIFFLLISFIYNSSLILLDRSLIQFKATLYAYAYVLKNISSIISSRTDISRKRIYSHKKLKEMGLFANFFELFKRFLKLLKN